MNKGGRRGVKIAAIVLMFLCEACFARAVEKKAESLSPRLKEQLSKHAMQLLSQYSVLKGSVMLEITLNRSGKVELVETQEMALDDTEPLAGILEKVYKWKFSPLNIQEEKITFHYPLRFSTELDSTRIFFIVMGAIVATITVLIVLVQIA